MIKRIADALLRRRHTDAPAYLTRQLTLQLAIEEGVDFAQAVLEFTLPGFDGSPQTNAEATRLRRWADDFIHVYGATAAALKREREG